jgi:exo-beta-1,3-glucanase (GH17 family)
VGNETQVFWSDHRVPPDSLIADIRWVRSHTRVPVTTADDFNFWNKPESRAVADEVDFIVMHAHPMWNGKQLGEALEWTAKTCEAIRAAHPLRTVVLGETGWATSVRPEGEQGRLIHGRPGEDEQKTFFNAVRAWAGKTRTTTFFFEAFDENWKGGSHPDEVEKHWGLFRADRTPKRAVSPRR